ncbi:uncharacterized protein A4U43_UnF11070 [Asparagus officinalis]|uniref:Uncharacterized protein n=1 Tax=Asparagus officinalis TaxID=4686 RepID=A0A1R3L5C3_ASPOF|nr:uncharacterized protein A4U43_UnF11070 [Asparagus officinalis]
MADQIRREKRGSDGCGAEQTGRRLGVGRGDGGATVGCSGGGRSKPWVVEQRLLRPAKVGWLVSRSGGWASIAGLRAATACCRRRRQRRGRGRGDEVRGHRRRLARVWVSGKLDGRRRAGRRDGRRAGRPSGSEET